MAALKQRGLRVAPFKVGPDFIDPGHHTRITANLSRNLDGWMLSKDYNLENFQANTTRADIAVVEGVMGLYDGYDGKTEAGSTAQMAKWLDLPVVLVVNAKSMARSAAAVIQGFENFDRDLKFCGVIFNNLGSDRHLPYLLEALEANVAMPCLGGIKRDEKISIPERHLGLVTRQDHLLTDDDIRQLAAIVEDNLDLDDFLAKLPEMTKTGSARKLPPAEKKQRVRIGVAKDNAFCFYYQENLERLESFGAEIVNFSPIRDKELPDDLDGLYFGGGYPELFAAELAENTGMIAEINSRSRAGMPIYAECGGFMYLCRAISTIDGETFSMTGCFPFATQMHPRLKALGYREITLTRDTVIGKSGLVIRGHEFHYSELTGMTTDPQTVYRISDRAGLDKTPQGYQVKRTLGSYNHLHFGSQPRAAAELVANCFAYQSERGKAT